MVRSLEERSLAHTLPTLLEEMVSGHESGGSPPMPPAAVFSGLLKLEAGDNGGMTVSLPSSIYIIMAKCFSITQPSL